MDDKIVRIMPNSIEAEQAVIGCMLINAAVIVEMESRLSAEDFYNKIYALLFTTIIDLNNEGKSVDVVILSERLKSTGAPEESYDFEFIRSLAMAVPTTENAGVYADIVKEKAALRKIISLGEKAVNASYLGDEKSSEILDSLQEETFSLMEKKAGSVAPINEIMIEAIEKINSAYKNRGKLSGIATGFYDLDYCLSGLQPSDFILIAARPSMGKTAFVLNVAAHAAIENNIATAIFSLEMSSVQLANRFISLNTGIAADKLRKGDLSARDWDNLVEGTTEIAESKLIIDDTPGISVAELRARARKYKIENDIGLIIIDYLQLMSGNGKSDSRQQEVSTISRELKSIARELNVPVVTLSQLSRAPEQRNDHRPMLSDLRESGAIEQDADVVMLLYRDDYYDKDSEDKNIAEVIVAKQRNGPVKTVKLAWIPEQTKFANLERQKDITG